MGRYTVPACLTAWEDILYLLVLQHGKIYQLVLKPGQIYQFCSWLKYQPVCGRVGHKYNLTEVTNIMLLYGVNKMSVI
jgi:hypothetical protein